MLVLLNPGGFSYASEAAEASDEVVPLRRLLNSPPSGKNGASRWSPFCCARKSPMVCLPLSVANGDVDPSLGLGVAGRRP